MLMNQILEYRFITILVPFPQKLTLIAKAHVPFESFGIFFQSCPESGLGKPWIWKLPLGDEYVIWTALHGACRNGHLDLLDTG
jgi:hypothetical protein